jgi:hypothetical protein
MSDERITLIEHGFLKISRAACLPKPRRRQEARKSAYVSAIRYCPRNIKSSTSARSYLASKVLGISIGRSFQ